MAIDDRLRRTIEEVARLEDEAQYEEQVSVGNIVELPEEEVPAPAGGAPRKGGRASKLTPKEIQAELRAGRTPQEVARLAGTEIAWIERFIGPILAEREGIVDAVKAGVISRPRRGRSGVPVGEAILANLRERKVPVSLDARGEGWTVLRRNGAWLVTFRYTVRGQARDAQFSFDAESGVKALNPTASQLAWREPDAAPAKPEPEPAPERVAPPRPPAVITARPSVVVKARQPVVKGRPAAPAPEPEKPVPGRPNLWGSPVATGGGRRDAQSNGSGPRPQRGAAQEPARSAPRPQSASRQQASPRQQASSPQQPAREQPVRSQAARPQGVRQQPAGRVPPAAQPARPGVSGNGRAEPGAAAQRGGPERSAASPRGAGPSDDRRSFATNTSSRRPQRLLSQADEEDFKAAVARTRASRIGTQQPSPPARTQEAPRHPQKKRLPDDWLLEP